MCDKSNPLSQKRHLRPSNTMPLHVDSSRGPSRCVCFVSFGHAVGWSNGRSDAVSLWNTFVRVLAGSSFQQSPVVLGVMEPAGGGIMDGSATEQRDFIPYPTNRVVGTVTDAQSAHAAVDALLEAGFAREDIDFLHGADDAHRLDPTGEAYGFRAQFQRTLLRTAGPAEEHRHLLRHLEDVRAGRFVIMVLAKERSKREVAADILNAYGAEFIGFYGRWAWQGFTPPSDVSGGVEEHAVGDHALATTPDMVPSLFAAAWNTRAPDVLASLFDEDAEFVNVVGLWWHDRASIRTAHAYGLARIFNNSRLTVEEIRVKPLSADIAVVHARMSLSGQTPVGAVEEPGSRTTIFSFVVRRTGDRWLCAAAHNTDVIPRMDTNVVDDGGTHRAVNYRTDTSS
jgi:uncharacterized protein (TIGR02246 family)